MEWFFHTRVWRKMHGHEDGEAGVNNEIAEQSVAGIGAWILSATCLVLSGGPWPDDSWKGWWGDEPPWRVSTIRQYPRTALIDELHMAISLSYSDRASTSEWHRYACLGL